MPCAICLCGPFMSTKTLWVTPLQDEGHSGLDRASHGLSLPLGFVPTCKSGLVEDIKVVIIEILWHIKPGHEVEFQDKL